MKKKVLLVLLLILALAMTMLFTGCGGSSSDTAAPSETAEESSEAETAEEPAQTEEPAAPLTFEEYAKNDSSIQDQLGVDEKSGIFVDIKGNELIFTYDYSKMDGNFTREGIVNDGFKKNLEEIMTENGAGSTFGNIAKTMEDASGIEGITVTVEYTWEDEVVYSQSFTSADAES